MVFILLGVTHVPINSAPIWAAHFSADCISESWSSSRSPSRVSILVVERYSGHCSDGSVLPFTGVSLTDSGTALTLSWIKQRIIWTDDEGKGSTVGLCVAFGGRGPEFNPQ